MAIVRWTPFYELADMRREMQSLRSLMRSRFVPFVGGEDTFVPAIDMTTRGDDLLVKVELPGVDWEKDVDISVEGDALHISGRRTAEREEEKGGYRFHEMRYGSFERTVPLPEGTDADAITAEYRDGILEVKVAGGAKKLEAPEARKIPIKKSVEQSTWPTPCVEGVCATHAPKEPGQ